MEIRELIRALSAEHTVVFSSHILSEVQQACSRVIILDEGRMALDYDAAKPDSGIMKLRLKIAGKKEETLSRLRRLDGVLEAEALPGEDPDVLEARVAAARGADGGEALDRLFRALADSGLPVRMMREEQENLEEVFLRVVSS